MDKKKMKFYIVKTDIGLAVYCSNNFKPKENTDILLICNNYEDTLDYIAMVPISPRKSNVFFPK